MLVTERWRIMEGMIKRDHEREQMLVGAKERHTRRRREKDLIKKMGVVGLNPLGQTISRLLNSSRVSDDPYSEEFLTFAEYGVKDLVQHLKSLDKFRERIGSKRRKALEEKIREAAWEFEDALDSHVSDQFLSQSETTEERFQLNLEGIEKKVDDFIEKVMNMGKLFDPWFDGGEEESDIFGLSDQSGARVTRSRFMSWFATKAASMFLGKKEDYIQDLENLLPEDNGEEYYDYVVLFERDFSRCRLDVYFSKINDDLIAWWINKAAASISVEEEQLDNSLPEDDDESALNLVGSTDLFKEIIDELMQGPRSAAICGITGMVGIGKTALAKKILQDPSIRKEFDCRIFVRMGPEYESDKIKQAILAQMPDGDECHKVKQYLIVLDDVWDQDVQSIFSNTFPNEHLPDYCVLVTTRLSSICQRADGKTYFVSFLNKSESWDLLRQKIFGEKRCPHELEKAGKRIAENCEGLPLLIVKVAKLLSEDEQTPEYWTKVAADKTNSIFVGAYEQISKVAYPSYYYLPQHLKACFLYFGVFPQNDEVRVSKLIRMWSSEGFLGVSKTLVQRYAREFLMEIMDANVARGTQWSSLEYTWIGHRLKACTLHSVFWYLCAKEAQKEKFLRVLNSYANFTVEGIEGQRRLSTYKAIILCIKDVRDSIASLYNVRSLLCTGPYHQYEVPIILGLKLLKVLDALTIRMYEFPIEVVELIHLRYLALNCNGKIPPSISKLWSLQSLILHQNQRIKSGVSQSYLPVEIWGLQDLEYLQIMGRNLPDPPNGVVLKSLLVLLDTGAHTCTKRVLESIPNLEKLRVQIELMPASAEPLSFCDDISHFQALTSVQFVVVNRVIVRESVAPPPLFSFYKLLKLTLSGFGYPWEYMNYIAELFNLVVLKLKCYAFRGEKWEVKEGEFPSLRYLSVEDTDLVQWTGGNENFPALQLLVIKNCFKLEEIPKLSDNTGPREIRVVDCNPSAVTCANQMATKNCMVYADSSWLDDEKLS